MAKATTAKKAPAKESLPGWNLSDLYKSADDPALARDSKKIAGMATAFRKSYQGKIAKLKAAKLAVAIAEYEKIQDIAGRIGSFAQLAYSVAMTDGRVAQFYQNTSEMLTDISSQLLFFTLEINKLDEKQMKVLLKDSAALKRYTPWLRDVRAYRKYQLSDDIEKLLLEKSVAGGSAWARLFDEAIAQMKFSIGGKDYSSAEAFDFMSHKDEAKRKAAAQSIGEVLGKHSYLFTLITNTLAKDKEVEDKWRGFKAPISSRNLSNHVEDEVVQALIGSVKKSYPDLSHRYYKLKAKWLGKKQMEYWDRNAPLPFDDDRTYSWDEAKSITLEAYAAFSPELAKIGQQFFDRNWIDVPVRPGKSPGAFAHPTVPSAHPYLLLNFQGKTRDVMTLAHELGHGVHQVLSARQGALMCDTPLTLAETASVFGEQLVFREVLRREKNEKRRKALIASKVEDMLNTVVRQVAFCEFETRVHDARRKGELTGEEIGAIWMQVQKESLGPAIRFQPEYAHYWSYIPHFIHTPFYVYAYAFGDCLVNALYAHYEQESGKKKGREFEQKYIEMLKAGGTLHHKDLLKPFGINIAKPEFWEKGLGIISGYIDELK